MAIDPSVEYVGKITAPDINYTYGSAKAVTTPTSQDGTPWSLKLVNDILGFQQAKLKVAGFVPSGNAETQLASQYLSALNEITTNQNYGADAANTNAYVASTISRATQYKIGLYLLKVTNANTGAVTVNYDGLGVKSVKDFDGSAFTGGELAAGRISVFIYNGTDMILLRTDDHGVVQEVNTETGAVDLGTIVIPFDDSKPENDEGDPYMSRTITPKNSSNILRIDVVSNISSNVANNLTVALFQDAIVESLCCSGSHAGGGGNEHRNIKFTYFMVAGTVSEITFTVRAGGENAGTTTFNGVGGARKYGGALISSITVTEMKPA